MESLFNIAVATLIVMNPQFPHSSLSLMSSLSSKPGLHTKATESLIDWPHIFLAAEHENKIVYEEV